MMYEVDISDAMDWIAHTDWLGNPAEEYSVSRKETVLDFSVREPGRGMKWSRHFEEPIDLVNMPYVIVRYRAEGIAASGDYFLYLNGKVGDSTKEFYVIMPGDLEDDGRWRTAIAEIPPTQLNWVASSSSENNGSSYSSQIYRFYFRKTDTFPRRYS